MPTCTQNSTLATFLFFFCKVCLQRGRKSSEDRFVPELNLNWKYISSPGETLQILKLLSENGFMYIQNVSGLAFQMWCPLYSSMSVDQSVSWSLLNFKSASLPLTPKLMEGTPSGGDEKPKNPGRKTVPAGIQNPSRVPTNSPISIWPVFPAGAVLSRMC